MKVIRGEEWLLSTPKHHLLYRALGFPVPQFAHLPLLLNPDRSKVSKRVGGFLVSELQAQHYLPSAVINFVALLGWGPSHTPHQESTEETSELFYNLEGLVDAFEVGFPLPRHRGLSFARIVPSTALLGVCSVLDA